MGGHLLSSKPHPDLRGPEGPVAPFSRKSAKAGDQSPWLQSSEHTQEGSENSDRKGSRGWRGPNEWCWQTPRSVSDPEREMALEQDTLMSICAALLPAGAGAS